MKLTVTSRNKYKNILFLLFQACRVTGQNLTPCTEIKKEGTDVILIDFEPDKGNVIVCDCVGILKERHSDIEGKMVKQKMRTNWKKKSTKCRMVFRTEVELANGKTEILQVVSDPISCTQLPGTPEILKMSLSSCDPCGGEELWMIGKNFMKDSVVIFQVSPAVPAVSRQCNAYTDAVKLRQSVTIKSFLRTPLNTC